MLAKDAKELADRNHNYELIEITKAIQIAAGKGKYQLTSEQLKSTTVASLIKVGYLVDNDKNKCVISWEHST